MEGIKNMHATGVSTEMYLTTIIATLDKRNAEREGRNYIFIMQEKRVRMESYSHT